MLERSHRVFAPPALRFCHRASYMTPMSKLRDIQCKARELAQSGTFYGWRPIEFVLLFEDGISDAREWLYDAATDLLCRKAKAPRLAAT
jgi:hypothetical protein